MTNDHDTYAAQDADNDGETVDLEVYFSAARVHHPDPSEGLMTRILADAKHPTLDSAIARPLPARAGFWRGAVLPQLGGWSGLGGLAACAVFGLGAGVSWVPELVPGLGIPEFQTELMFEDDLAAELSFVLSEEDT